MTKLYTFCSAGTSSSLLVAKMQKAADARDLNMEILYFGESDIATKAKEADIILLSPQIKYREAKVRKDFTDKIVYTIGMQNYGLMKVDAILDDCIQLLEQSA